MIWSLSSAVIRLLVQTSRTTQLAQVIEQASCIPSSTYFHHLLFQSERYAAGPPFLPFPAFKHDLPSLPTHSSIDLVPKKDVDKHHDHASKTHSKLCSTRWRRNSILCCQSCDVCQGRWAVDPQSECQKDKGNGASFVSH